MSETTNVAMSSNTYNLYQNSVEDAGKELRSSFYNRGVKLKPAIKPTQNQNKEEVIGTNKDKSKRKVRFNLSEVTGKELRSSFYNSGVKLKPAINSTQDQNKEEVIGINKDKSKRKVRFKLSEVTPQTSSVSVDTKGRQQAEDLYYYSILPEVKKTFTYRDKGSYHEVPINAIMDVLDTKISIDKTLNFLCNDPDFIPQIIEKSNALEFTKVIDLLLNTISNADISEIESQQVFNVLDKLYKKLPEIAHVKPSLYGKMHALFGLVLNDNRQGVIHTLIEAMTSDHSNKYFNLYINDDSAIENNYLDLIIKIYSSTKEIQEDDYSLFEKLLVFLGANDFVETQITSAKALHLAIAISNIVYNFDEPHQDIFIEYFLARKIDGSKLDNLLVKTLDQNGLLKKYNDVISSNKDISKIPQYNVINYLAQQDQEALSSNKINNTLLLETETSDRKQQVLSMINKLSVYNCHTLVDYLSSTDDIVFQEVIASKSTKVYEHMIDLLITNIQSTTTISEEDSNKIIELLKQLYITLPSIGRKSQPLCSKIYKAFNLLIPQSINLIMDILYQAINSNSDFYFPLSATENNKNIISNFLDLIAKIYKTPTEDYKLLYELLEYIKINISNDSSSSKILFFTEKLYKIIINLQDERQSMIIKSLLDSRIVSIDMKYYLYCLFYDASINIPECKFQPLDQIVMEHAKQRMELIKTRDPYFLG